MPNYYPIYIDLEDKPVLVVGGGTVALRKVTTLLQHGALVRIVSPKLVPELYDLVDNNKCKWVAREYASEDIEDAILVFSCTEKESVNFEVAQDSKALKRLINAVDDPKNCTFIVPSIMKRGDLTIAVSTGGSSPMAARLIREELEDIYGDEMRIYLELLHNWRKKIKQYLPMNKRQEFWNRVTDGEVLGLIKQGQLDQAKEVMEDCFRLLSD